MSEFWVSQGRVYCEFCKCWYADNKVEKETHERGSKHQELKTKALASIRKISEFNAKEQDKIECFLAEADRAAREAYKRDLRESGITAKSLKRQRRDEEKQKEIDLEKEKQRQEAKDWHEAKDSGGNIYYWNSKTRETRWKPPPMWECKAKSIEAAAEEGASNVKISKPSFKKSGKGLFKSSAGTNNTANSVTSGLKKNSAFAKTLSWKGADDGKIGSKRSNDVAYGTWVPKKVEEVHEEVKQETAESLGLPPEADAFYEEEANDKEKYKGFTFKEDRFQIGDEKQAEVISIEESSEPVAFKKKTFGGKTRQRTLD